MCASNINKYASIATRMTSRPQCSTTTPYIRDGKWAGPLVTVAVRNLAKFRDQIHSTDVSDSCNV